MHPRRRLFLLLLLATVGLGAPACTKVYTDPDRNTVTSTGPTPVATADKIEFRVLGTQLSAFAPLAVRHTDALNGITLYSGGVPYYVSFNSVDNSVFLYIEAEGTGNQYTSTLQVQIYVNGRLFREGFATGYTPVASASGTYRR